MKNYLISCIAIFALTIFSSDVSADSCSSSEKCAEKSLKRNDRGNSNSGGSRSQNNRGSARPQTDRSTSNGRRSSNTSRNRSNDNVQTGRSNSRNTATTSRARSRNTSTSRDRNNRRRVVTNRGTTSRNNRVNRPSTRYVRNVHTRYNSNRAQSHRWRTSRDYFRTISFGNIYSNRWLRVGVSWNDGYYWNDNYPWYSYNGYRHRYSNVDNCNYELVDAWNNTVERTYYNSTCSYGYDSCAFERDRMNEWSSDYRYFCSERLEGSIDDYDFNDDYYSNDEWDDDFNDNWN